MLFAGMESPKVRGHLLLGRTKLHSGRRIAPPPQRGCGSIEPEVRPSRKSTHPGLAPFAEQGLHSDRQTAHCTLANQILRRFSHFGAGVWSALFPIFAKVSRYTMRTFFVLIIWLVGSGIWQLRSRRGKP